MRRAEEQFTAEAQRTRRGADDLMPDGLMPDDLMPDVLMPEKADDLTPDDLMPERAGGDGVMGEARGMREERLMVDWCSGG